MTMKTHSISILLAALAGLMLSVLPPVHGAAASRAAQKTSIDTNLPSGESGAITAAKLRTELKLLVDSAYNPIDDGTPGTVTTFSAGNLSPLFTSSVANATTAPALTYSLSTAAQNAVLAGPATGGTGAPSYRTLVAGDMPDLSGVYQPLDSDLTEIAALTTTSNGRSLLTASALTAAGLGLTNGSTIDAWGAITNSSGIAGRVSDETGSGALVFATSPTFVTPTLGAATATSVNGLTISSSSGTLTITNGKTAAFSNTLTFAGTDGSTLNVGTGGTLGTAAYTAADSYLGLSGGTLTGNLAFGDTGEGTTFHGGGSITGASGAIAVTASGTNQDIIITPSGTGMLRLTGNATHPTPVIDTLFHMVAPNAKNSTWLLDSWGANPTLLGRRAHGNAATPTATGAEQTLLFLGGLGYGETAYATASKALIMLRTSEAWTDSAQGAYIRFETTQNGSTTRAEAARLYRNLLVGGTTDIDGGGGLKLFGSTAATSTTSGALQVVGGMGIGGAAHIGGLIVAGSGATTLTDSSGKILSAALNTVGVAQGGTGITSFGTGIATWLGTPSSANLAAAISDETGTGAAVFASGPQVLDNGALAADDTWSGRAISGLTAGATIAQWELVYLGASSTWLLADANGSGTYPARGISVAAYSSTDPAVVLHSGTVRNDGWDWTPGGTLYLSTTPGGLTQTAPSTADDIVQQVGFALTADIAFFDFASGEHVTVGP